MNIPMALRHIKPGVAHLATDVFCQHPEILDFLPATTHKQRIWLAVVNWAFKRVNPDFGRWVARRVPEVPGGRIQEVGRPHTSYVTNAKTGPANSGSLAPVVVSFISTSALRPEQTSGANSISVAVKASDPGSSQRLPMTRLLSCR
jgi:hypothetical protein